MFAWLILLVGALVLMPAVATATADAGPFALQAVQFEAGGEVPAPHASGAAVAARMLKRVRPLLEAPAAPVPSKSPLHPLRLTRGAARRPRPAGLAASGYAPRGRQHRGRAPPR
ncbi:hypothetical protein CMZ84_09385 [Lysobacteraceae bacterium NML93-0399]|nr:hypothetical protein CMZ84_09385 [Xanthomonadaceae bacterium NML93-0399]